MQLLTSYHPAVFALQALNRQFPAALGMYLFCYDKGLKAYEVNSNDKTVIVLKDLNINNNKSDIQKFRSLKSEISWCEKEDLPLSIQTNTTKQITIDDEIGQNVLVLRVPSAKDDLMDVFAIVFPKSFSNFYLQSGRNSLSSETKKGIGRMIRSQVLWLNEFHSEQSEIIEQIQKAYKYQEDERDKAVDQLKEEKLKNGRYLDQYLKTLIREKEIALDCEIRIKEGFRNRLHDSGVSINGMRPVIETAISTAYNLALDKSLIELSAHFIPDREEKVKPDEDRSFRLIQLDKTITLLDRYEQSARNIERSGRRVNGKNLAEDLEISGPAITDAIKKHASKISRLLEKYPSKWPLICEYIKPVREIKWQVSAKNA